MKYKSFEDLPVWQAAIDLARRTYILTEHQAFRGHTGLRDQLERAALSVSNNIAEGFERGTTNELLAFLYIARGSSGEVRSMLCLLERIPSFSSLKSEIGALKSNCLSISRQLYGWIEQLKNSDITGQRHLNDKIRTRTAEKKDQEEFLKELARISQSVKPSEI
ncbi:MAG: four helix bundle protein [Nitrospira sp. BO4]|jgi:four helix bundle protein|nr:four helix bundle protein [Nitrospira sp. BO4]